MTAQPISLSEQAVFWLATGERGLSSNTLFTFLTGVDATKNGERHYPHDAGDFARCRKLIEQCPELAALLPRVATAGREWAAIVEHWQALCDTMDEEAPLWREKRGWGHKTTRMIQNIIKSAKKRSNKEES